MTTAREKGVIQFDYSPTLGRYALRTQAQLSGRGLYKHHSISKGKPHNVYSATAHAFRTLCKSFRMEPMP